MPCDITLGRNEPCKDSVGGLRAVFFQNFSQIYTGSLVGGTGSLSDTINGGFSGSTVYNYELKGNSTYTETIVTSRDNGTTAFQQVLVLNLKSLDATTTKQLKLLAYGRPQIFVQTNKGDTLLVGRINGADVTEGTIAETGASLGDKYGYSLTFTGLEQLPANFVSGSTVANAFGTITNAPTIVYGTN
jgi:hypothetical protein